MLNGRKFRRNTFHETLLALEYESGPNRLADLFSRACVETYSQVNWRQFGYVFTQIFEPGVLREVALLEGVSYQSLVDLSHQPSATITHLADLADHASDLSLVELVNLISAFVSISRFNIAAHLLAGASDKVTTSREKFEVAWLEFLISNRLDHGKDSPAAFAKMREATETGGIPPGRILNACTQAVVWYIKRREVQEDVVKWWVGVGNSLVKTANHLDLGTMSSWYRGLAMLPAAKGKAPETRKFMELARSAAEQMITQHTGAYEFNTLKTYYESTMKEHMYVTRNVEAAEVAGFALIALDPVWAPSYGELAEVYDRFGQTTRAAELYEQAADIGPPYLGHHLLHAARCRVRSGNDEKALDHYLTLAEIAPHGEQALKEGLETAGRISLASRANFEHQLERLGAASRSGR